MSIRVRLACWVIEKGIWMLPDGYRSQRFINNCIKTGHIKPEPPK